MTAILWFGNQVTAKSAARRAEKLADTAAHTKSQTELDIERMRSLDTGTRELIQGYRQSLTDVRAELAEVRADLERCEAKHSATQTQMDTLRDDMQKLREQFSDRALHVAKLRVANEIMRDWITRDGGRLPPLPDDNGTPA